MTNRIDIHRDCRLRATTGAACALAMLSGLWGCDETMMVGETIDDGSGGEPSTMVLPEGTGGAGGIGGVALTSPLPTGGTTTSAGTGGATTALGVTHGAGGQIQTTTPIPAGCAPISLSPGTMNPCGRTFDVAFSPDGKLLATGLESAAPNVRLWRLSDGMPLPDPLGQGSETTYDVAFSPDGTMLAAAGYRRVPSTSGSSSDSHALVRVWDVATGALLRELEPNCGWYADNVEFSNDGLLVLTGGYLGAVELWRIADGTRLLAIDVATSAHNAHFSPDNTRIIVATFDGEANVYDIGSGTRVLGPLAIAVEMADAQFSPDQKQIATTWQSSLGADGENQVRIYDGASGQLVQSLPGHSQYISHVVWIDQDRIVSDDWGGNVMLWQRDASGAFTLGKSWSAGGQSLGLAVSPDKTLIVTAAGGAGFIFLPL